MVETVGAGDPDGIAAAAQLLRDFNAEYDEPTPPPAEIAARLGPLIADDHVSVLLVRDEATTPVGVAVFRVQPSVWGPAPESYLAELYVIPTHRGRGFGRRLITEFLDGSRRRGADYALVVTSEDDRLAQRLYSAAGFRRTEGVDGPLMLAYERDL